MLITNLKKLDEIRTKVLEQFSELLQSQTTLRNFRETMSELINDALTDTAKLKKMEDRLVNKNAQLLKTLKLLQAEEKILAGKGSERTKYALHHFNKVVASLDKVILQLDHYSTHDLITNLHNRRFFNEMLDQEISRSLRYQSQFTLLFIDIDDFKSINDNYGHPAGDATLMKIADIFITQLRKHDVIARIAGDEFAIILPQTDLVSGRIVAEKLRAVVAETEFDDFKKGFFQSSISIGIVCFPEDATTAHGLMSVVDTALYNAKKGGKNKISHLVPDL